MGDVKVMCPLERILLWMPLCSCHWILRDTKQPVQNDLQNDAFCIIDSEDEIGEVVTRSLHTSLAPAQHRGSRLDHISGD